MLWNLKPCVCSFNFLWKEKIYMFNLNMHEDDDNDDDEEELILWYGWPTKGV